jgi:hypothetical protein
VWSLIAGLAAIGGIAPRVTYDELLNPGYRKGGVDFQAKRELAANANGVALSLNLVQTHADEARLLINPPTDFAGFADHIHDHLAGLATGDQDAPILEAFAWVAAESDIRGGIEWVYQSSREEFSDRANSALAGEDEGGKPMNTTKLTAWRRWLAFLGLGISLPMGSIPDFPSPTNRILRELSRSELSPGTVMGAEEFVAWIASRMPYLDRGRLYIQACTRMSHRPADGRLSPLLSTALRELHDEQVIQMSVSGDAVERLRLTDDSAHAINAFTAVCLGQGTTS